MMTTHDSAPTTDRQVAFSSFSTRDLIAIGFRHQRALMITFGALLLGAILATIFLPPDYQASTRFLIEHERLDPVVTPDQHPEMVRPGVTEEELNSEVELLQSNDVLRQVVINAGLNQRHSFWNKVLNAVGLQDTEEEKIAKSARTLGKELKIEAVRKSNMIKVSYISSDPQKAAKVLQCLDEAYLQKNLAVHHPQGEFQFFDQEAESYKKNLADAESQLKVFSQQEGGVSPQLARDITLQKLSDFAASLQQTYADIATVERRIDALEKQSGTTPQRLTTQSHVSDNASVLQNLKSTLMTLELKRTELLTKYQPTYPLVQEVDKELADTRASIAAEESKPLRDETTDRNPTYAWISEELAKAKAEDNALQARAAAIRTIVARYQANAHDLEQKGIVQQDLLRRVRAEEQSYMMYQRKREEARMTDALDQSRILNVAVAERPITPALPAYSRWIVFLLGLLIAVVVSIGATLVLEYTDASFRTPTEVSSELNIPVLAAVPHYAYAFQANGNGHNGNGHNGNGHNGNGNGYKNGNGNGVHAPATDVLGIDLKG
ncbi:MAG TPA: GumC family protein [Candidatus Sulfotelmatobacter sp.]|nr:GumC family protein [Candidatus Sulfotelmatobacter sp.]